MTDSQFIVAWWFILFLLGIIYFPITSLLFSKFEDKGYMFAKVFGILITGYLVFLLGTLRLLPFTIFTILAVLLFGGIVNAYVYKKKHHGEKVSVNKKVLILEEVFFLIGIIFWSLIRGAQPDINGLEKFMDFGFVNSVLRSEYFPATDMWFPPEPINYYYFGHFLTALLTKLSTFPSFITYNLMLATLFAFTFALSFSIGFNLLSFLKRTISKILGGFLAACLVALSGNLHTLYSLFTPYPNESPVPFWELALSVSTFPNQYWYPNATRFIPVTIHEFPIYSFVVSDLHGHVLSIPIVLTIIAFLLHVFRSERIKVFHLAILSFLLSCAYMTNAWDLPIYLLLSLIVLAVIAIKAFLKHNRKRKSYTQFLTSLSLRKYQSFFLRLLLTPLFMIGLIGLITLPFNYFFVPFSSGIGILCAPSFLTSIGSIGPFLFEADHCQHSPWWQLLTLYGFFLFFSISFFVALQKKWVTFSLGSQFIVILIFFSFFLITLPEFIYAKDIYPEHYRANTMFKLTYQAFIMLSLSSAFVITAIISQRKQIIFYLLSTILVASVMIYPYFAVTSYYGELTYKGLNGIAYMQSRLPNDYQSVMWIQEHIKGQPVILEAQGDSYTDFARISANTGLPTVLGWTVHEWLWRGEYSIPAPRIEDVKTLYETTSVPQTQLLIDRYNIEYVYIGNLERETYQNLNEKKFMQIGKVVYENAGSRIYKIN